MKRNALIILLLSFLMNVMNAQQFVTTEVQNKNVILEEYTGKYCTWCPEGQVVANGVAKSNPGRVFLVNIHAGSFSPTHYPNLNTDDGTAMVESNELYSFPAGYVNRASEYAVGREQWSMYTMEQLSQTAICNIDGQVVIDPQTRQATINVEVYYTSSSEKSSNFLTVMMLQDDIIGDQEGAAANPEQYIDGQYHHNHVLRDVITPTFGEEFSPTTEGTLITKTYNYTIPETIGSPNGVEAVLENISFVAFVTEYFDGYQTCPVLNVNELPTIIDSNEEVNPKITAVYPSSYTSCHESNILKINVLNAGKQEITSLKFEVDVNGTTSEFSWEGNIPSHRDAVVEFDMTTSVGTNNITATIVEANSVEYNFSKTIKVEMNEWIELDLEAEEETLTIEVAQDKYGHQTKWFVLTSDYTILASGGPYPMLSDVGTELHTETLTLTKGDCVKFIITDAGGNGINGSNGAGYYKILNSSGDVIVDGNGSFGIEASHLISMKIDDTSVEENINSFANAYPNPTDGELTIECRDMNEIIVFMPNGQILEKIAVSGDSYVLNMNGYDSGVYFVKIITRQGSVINKIIKR